MKEKIENNIKIYESKNFKFLSIIYYFILYIFISAILLKEDNEMKFWYVYILISTPLLIYYITKKVKEIRKPPKKILVLSIDGISVPIYGFIEWKNIKGECINSSMSIDGMGTHYSFEFTTNDNKTIEFPGFGLTKNIFQIRQLVKKYRKYYEEYVVPKYN